MTETMTINDVMEIVKYHLFESSGIYEKGLIQIISDYYITPLYQKPFVSNRYDDYYSDTSDNEDLDDIDISDLLEYCKNNPPKPFYFPTSTNDL